MAKVSKRYAEAAKLVDRSKTYSIEEAVKYLRQLSYETGKDYCGTFNGHKLTSDMTVDEAYIKCTGKTFKEFKDEQEKMRQDLIRREEDHKKKIPELTKYWIKEGHKVLSQDKRDEWDKCVPIRLGDLYEISFIIFI